MEFFCTGGRGTEVFIADELRKTFQEDLINVNQTDGKVFFQLKDSGIDIYQKLIALRTPERCMIQLVHTPVKEFGKRALLTQVHTTLGNKDIWKQYNENVIHLNHATAPKMDVQLCKEDITNNEHRKNSNIYNHTLIILPNSCPQIYAVDEVENNEIISSISGNAKISESLADEKEKEEVKKTIKTSTSTDSGTSCGNLDLAMPCDVDRSDDECAILEQNSMKRKLLVSDEYKNMKKQHIEECSDPTFRVSCRFTGKVRQKLDVQRTSHQLGYLIGRLTNWKVALKQPDIEICVHMSESSLTVGVPISREPLSKRSYVLESGLRSTVAWIMINLLEVQCGDVVLDPMCGKGTLLVELVNSTKTAMCVGMDNDTHQLTVARDNVKHAGFDGHIDLVWGDVTNLPLLPDSVDRVVTDAPFGQNHVPGIHLHTFYSNMLAELSRILKPGARLVLLTSNELLAHLHGWISSCCCNEGHNGSRTSINICDQTVEDSVTNIRCSQACPQQADSCVARKYVERNQQQVKVCETRNKSLLSCKGSQDYAENRCNSCVSEKKQSSEMCSLSRDRRVSGISNDKPVNICQCDACNKSWSQAIPFVLQATFYVKLGETEGVICVLQNEK